MLSCARPPARPRVAGEENAGTAGDPPVTSRHYAPAQLGRQRSRMWGTSHNEVDSLQAAMDDFQVSVPSAPPAAPAASLQLDLPLLLRTCVLHPAAAARHLYVLAPTALPAGTPGLQEEEEGGGARVGSARRRMLRRNSVSMILENPVLAQVRVCVG